MTKSAEEKLLYILNTQTDSLYSIKSDTSQKDETIWRIITGNDDQLQWRPSQPENDTLWFTFVGSGNSANLDIYLGYIKSGRPVTLIDNPLRLTTDDAVDAYPRWRPDGNAIVFVSSRTGNGDIYLLENIDRVISSKNPQNARLRRLTTNELKDRDPVWHPGGNILVFAEFKKEVSTGVENFGIAMYDFRDEKYMQTAGPIRLTVPRDKQQETNPSWSHDGTKLAYYITSELKQKEKEKGIGNFDDLTGLGEKVNIEWGTFGAPDGGRPVKPFLNIVGGKHEFFAADVVPDYRGPMWGSNSQTILFVRYDAANFFPIVAADIKGWEEGRSQEDYMTVVNAGTRQNSSIFLLTQNGKLPRVAFIALEGFSYCLHAMDLGGSYFPNSTGDFVDAAWLNRPENPYSGNPWYKQKKYYAIMGAGIAGIYFTLPGGESNKPLPPIGSIPDLPSNK